MIAIPIGTIHVRQPAGVGGTEVGVRRFGGLGRAELV
jgi:hypothetical protein